MVTQVPVFMSDPRFDKISNRIIESYPNACILYIDEIINDELLSKYLARKEKIKETRGFVNEMQLFHGTHEKIVPVIASDGFDPSFNKRAAFGYGVYFAKHANYSSAYMTADNPQNHTFMFMCDVLVGVTKTGGQKDDTSFDNNIDKSDPTIVTTVYPDGAYPRFIIAFYKNAK